MTDLMRTTEDRICFLRESMLLSNAVIKLLSEAILSVDVDENDWCPFCKSHPSSGHSANCVYMAVKKERP